ncbi:MAG: WYL domain-containing protein [Tissierellia bacterium]|nr:WYL domain-containing protein [Tissierellia bacterium]
MRVGSVTQRMKLLFLKDILLSQTDMEHGMTMAEIIEALASMGVKAERKSIYTDMELLRNYGIKIETVKTNTVRYYVEERDFELAELKMLVDAVQSSRFTTPRKTDKLIKKIASLAGVYQADRLNRQLIIPDRAKTINESIFYNIDAIHEAIHRKRKISFKYFDYNTKKRRIYRKGGELYCETPLTLCWNDDEYYLIAYNSKHEKIVHYRVDRMSDVIVCEEKGMKLSKKEFNLKEYTKKHFGMFGGELVSAALRFDKSLVNVVLDKFGKDIVIMDNEDTFDIHVEVSNSPVFLSWIFQFRGLAKIVAPKELQRDMLEIIEKNINNYK